MFGITKEEIAVLKKLSTPIKIQDFLDSLPINHEKKGDTYMSPRMVLKEQKAHCFEGALLAALALWMHGEEPLILDLQCDGDMDHVVALYKVNGYFGAISKTNHATLRFRDPVYKTLRELALSYFHEYFNDDTGKKALRRYSTRPFNLKKLGTEWITSEKNLHYIAQMIDDAPHTPLITHAQAKLLRKADAMEHKAASFVEWKATNTRT
jgi:hypothetical protein